MDTFSLTTLLVTIAARAIAVFLVHAGSRLALPVHTGKGDLDKLKQDNNEQHCRNSEEMMFLVTKSVRVNFNIQKIIF